MKTRYCSIIGVVIFVVLLSACGNVETSEDKLVGEWQNISIEVTMETVNGSDTSHVFKANEQNWEQKLGIKPIRTSYNKDGSFVSRYYALNDSLLRESSGSWEVKGDSLYMYQSSPDSVIYSSVFSVQNDTARFEMMVDWDQDGKKDDYYVGVQKRRSD